jgi:hypothetical protein
MSRTSIYIIALCCTVPAGTLLRAELPPLPPEVRRAQASHIVTGTVRAVASYEHVRPEKDFTDTRYLIELSIDTVEKGEGLKVGKVMYVRAWKAKSRPAGLVGPGGHYHIPAAGEKPAVYVQQAADGGFDVLLPKGFKKAAR